MKGIFLQLCQEGSFKHPPLQLQNSSQFAIVESSNSTTQLENCPDLIK